MISPTNNLSAVVDGSRFNQHPTRIWWNEIIEVSHSVPAIPQKRMWVLEIVRRIGFANYQAAVVDAVSDTVDTARQSTEVTHPADGVPDETMSVVWTFWHGRLAHHLFTVINASGKTVIPQGP